MKNVVQKIRPLIVILLIWSCNNHTDHKRTITGSKVAHKTQLITTENSKDTISKILEIAKSNDSIHLDNWEPFIYLRAGKIFSKRYLSAVLITQPKKDKLKIEILKLSNSIWKKESEIELPEEHLVQFYVDYEDYNFDNQKDIYIQSTASNGYSLSRGNLVIVNPSNHELSFHPEAKKLANMKPDLKRKIIISDSLIFCQFQEVCKLENEWIKGELKTRLKNCDCK